MRSEEQAEIIRRLRTTRGHLEGVIGMVERGESCEQILHQLGAVQAALRAASTKLLLCQVEHSRDAILYSTCVEDQVAEVSRLNNLYSLLFQYANFVEINSAERKAE